MLEVYCSEHFGGRFETIAVPPAGAVAPTWYRCRGNRPGSWGRSALQWAAPI